MAWYMELTEWVNTLERFKNWKQHKGKPLEMQLDELADVLAFGLSLYLQVSGRVDVEFVETMESILGMIEPGKQTFDLTFLSTYIDIFESNNHWHLIVIQLPLTIAYDLYSIDQLLDAYEKKMKVNHDRQDNGY